MTWGVPSQATLAYQTGNKALAKELGVKGRAANQAMKAAHATASADIHTSRNAAHAQVPPGAALLACMLCWAMCPHSATVPDDAVPGSGLQTLSEMHLQGFRAVLDSRRQLEPATGASCSTCTGSMCRRRLPFWRPSCGGATPLAAAAPCRSSSALDTTPRYDLDCKLCRL
jgi:Domain of unknown function (DUF1771)